MRTRYRWDKQMDCLVEVRPDGNYFEEKGQAPNVISDDVGAGIKGLRHMPSGLMLDSKSRHRAETKARGLEEVGNETNFASTSRPREDYGRVVADAYQQFDGNWNGTADRVKAAEQQSAWRRQNGR